MECTQKIGAAFHTHPTPASLTLKGVGFLFAATPTFMGFNAINVAAQQWNEEVMGDSFTYDSAYSFTGVFAQVEVEYQFDEYSTRMLTAETVSTQKAQWAAAGVLPADKKIVTLGGVGYSIFKIEGLNSPSEPSYTLYLKRLT